MLSTTGKIFLTLTLPLSLALTYPQDPAPAKQRVKRWISSDNTPQAAVNDPIHREDIYPVTIAEDVRGDLKNLSETLKQEDTFLRLHQANQRAIQLGLLALEKSHTPVIRAYSQRLVRDHRYADRWLTSVAKNMEIKTAAQPLRARREEKNLYPLQGTSFDREFLRAARANEEEISQNLQQIELPVDMALTRLVNKVLPILRQHQRVAENLENNLVSSNE